LRGPFVLQRAFSANDIALLNIAAVLSRPLGAELGFDPGRLINELGECFDAIPGDMLREHVWVGVRRAQLEALSLSLRHTARSLHRRGAQDILEFSSFAARAWSFIEAESAAMRLPPQAVAQEAAAGGPDRRLERMAASAFLDQLTDACAPPPAGFAAVFSDISEELAWFDAFFIFMAWEMKSNDTLRDIAVPHRLPILRDLRVPPSDLISRVYQHATLLSNRFQRPSAPGGPEDQWSSHEQEKDHRLAALDREKARQARSVVATIAGAAGLEAGALIRLAAMLPQGRFGTHLAMEQVEEQARVLAGFVDRLRPLAIHADEHVDLPEAWSQFWSSGRTDELVAKLEKIAAAAAGSSWDDAERFPHACAVVAHHKAAFAALEEIRLRYNHAARLYADAGQLLWAVDDDQGFRFLISAARALYSQGRWLSDQTALRHAVTLLGDLDLHHRQQDAWSRSEYGVLLVGAKIRLGVLAKAPTEIEAALAVAAEVARMPGALSVPQARELNAAIADARLALFHHTGVVTHLDEALSALDVALAGVSQSTEPATFAALHALNSTVSLIRARTEKPPRSVQLANRAIESCASAAEFQSADVAPARHAELEERAGDAYSFLCTGPDAEHYRTAAQSRYIAAQGYQTSGRAPAAWARLQSKIGDIAFRLARGSERRAWIEEGMAAYDAALAAVPRETHAEPWASIRERLGDSAGAVTGPLEAQGLEIAVDAYTSASEVHTRETNPQAWARLQTRLAQVRQRRAKGDRLVPEAQASVAALRDVLEVYTKEADPKRWAATQHAIGTAHLLLAVGAEADRHLEESLSAHRLSLEARSLDTEPDLVAQLHQRIGSIELRLAKGENKARRGAAALAACAAGLEAAPRARAPERWADLMEQSGDARVHLAPAKDAEAELAEAVACYRSSLDVRSIDKWPAVWARLHVKIGNVEWRRSRESKSEKHRLAAVDAYREAARVYTKEKYPKEWESVQASLKRASEAAG